MKKVYLYNDENKFSGVWECQVDPMKPGEYIIPLNSTHLKPSYAESVFVDGKWKKIPAPVEPAPEPGATTTDIVVSPWQFRQALNEMGLRNQIEALVASTTNLNIKDGWEYATEWRESHPLVKNIAQELNVDNDKLHTLFLLAKSK